jgi:site-specific recombinase XerD
MDGSREAPGSFIAASPSLMQMNGVDPATMRKILGHRDIETTMIYTHQTDEHLKKSISRVDIR